MAGDALSYAARLLAKKAYSEREIRQKLLKREFSEDETEAALERLLALGALNDEAYAAQIAQHYVSKGCGAYKIKQELRRRGVEAEELPPTDFALIASLIAKKIKTGTKEEFDKAGAFLYRRGYSGEEIARALSDFRTKMEET